MTAPNVIDLNTVRALRQPGAPATLILQVIGGRRDLEVHRQVGIDSALSLAEFHRILTVCFGLPEEDVPWHFFEHDAARGARIDPQHLLGDFLARPGDGMDYTWGLWDFFISVADIYPRDADTPRALCVGGSGSFTQDFDMTTINARLTGRDTIVAVLQKVNPAVRELVLRTKLYDFVPLLQALDLEREAFLAPAVRAQLARLPREVTAEGRDAFWAHVLALTCMGDAALADEVVETIFEALGWVDDEGHALSAALARTYCDTSLRVLERLGACGPQQKSPVDRLDIYRALLRK